MYWISRSAEILHAIAWKSAPFHLSKWLLTEDSGFIELLRNARSNLSLFQHHDGITGTAKDFVVDDYALKYVFKYEFKIPAASQKDVLVEWKSKNWFGNF